jgi:hypothetical protein
VVLHKHRDSRKEKNTIEKPITYSFSPPFTELDLVRYYLFISAQSRQIVEIIAMRCHVRYTHPIRKITFDEIVMKKPNEENACNAFIEILKKITGVEYEIEYSPDEQNRVSSEVDYVLISKDGRSHRIAVEHTIVESFEGQIAYVNHSYDVVNEINVLCQEKLPTDRYYILTIPPVLIKSFKNAKQKKEQFVKEMSCWVPNIANTLAVNQRSSRVYNDQEIMIECGGSSRKMNGNVGRIPVQPMEIEKLKGERFCRDIEENRRKLRKYKRKGYTTALLLEDISGGFYRNNNAQWKDLRNNQKWSFKSIDYVVIFVSINQEMVVGNVWKEKRRLYSTIPHNRRFSLPLT